MDVTVSVDSADSDLAWDELLEYVIAGRIVPIVGPALLRTETAEGVVRLDQLIAERLAAQLSKGSARFPPSLLHPDEPAVQVAGRWLAQGGVPGEVSNAISAVLKSVGGLSQPRPLRQLAEITDFNLFVTLTWDGFLEAALRRARTGDQAVRVYNYSLRRPLPGVASPGRETSLLYLFGQASRLDDFAITEEDLLEYAHSVVSQPVDSRTPTLLDEVRLRNLLIIGADLPRWLSRFFLRFSKRYRLWMTRSERLVDFIADHTIEEDVALTDFLKTFSNRHVLFPSDPVDFVDELHRRWTERRAAFPSVSSSQEISSSIEQPQQPRIFISYASEDRQFVDVLKDALSASSLRVWLDRDALEAGDGFENRIQQAVRNSALFIPVLSAAGADPANRWFRKEWDWAARVLSERRRDLKFVCPIALGNIAPDSAWIPDAFKDVHWTVTNGTEVPSAFVSQLRDAYREYQRSRVR